MMPGIHQLMAKRKAGIVTSPVLELDGQGIGDSTAILQAIEERWPEPSLIPGDPSQRERALQLEDYFDEKLGPHIRRAVYYELLPYPDIVIPLFTDGASGLTRGILRAGFPVLRVGMKRYLNIYEEPAMRSRDRTTEALNKLEQELGDN